MATALLCATITGTLPVLGYSQSADSVDLTQAQTEVEQTRAKRQQLLLENDDLRLKEQRLNDEIEQLKTQQDLMQQRREALERERQELMRKVEADRSAEPTQAQTASDDAPFDIISRTPPAYPATAARDGIEGHVDLQFSLLADGRIADIRIIESVPEQVFDQSSIDAIRQWKLVNHAGKPLLISERLEYRIDNS